jgi:KipI family sensor histidine kinase inhibitor
VESYGDAAVLVTIPGAAATEGWQRLHTLAEELSAAKMPGIEGLVATYDSLLIEFDPHTLTPDDLDACIRAKETPTAARSTEVRTFRVPALYGGDSGPDLADVADELDLTVAQFIETHSSALWRIAFRGAPAGAPMLDGSPFDRSIARCGHPRIRVPAGSIAVSGRQGVIYPVDSPGGWRLVARTPLDVIDITRTPHLLYRPGDLIQFVPVSDSEAPYLRGILLGESP